MKKAIGYSLVVGLIVGLFVGAFYRLPKKAPKNLIKAPTTRYHGYELNRKAIEYAKGYTVAISGEGFNGGYRGTGVLLGPTYVLTCYHVVEHPMLEYLVYTSDMKEVYHAKMIFGSQEDDLAVLKLDRPTGRKGKVVFQADHYDGQPITIIGNALGSMKWFVAYGIISAEDDQFLYTDGAVMPGDSGGPWINEKGEVIALSDFGYRGTSVSGGIRTDVIGAFLMRWIISMSLPGMK